MDTFSNECNIIDRIIAFLGEHGLCYTKNELLVISYYIEAMLEQKRIIMIYDNNVPITICFYSICHDVGKHYNSNTWEFQSHDESGDIVFIDKLVSCYWNRNLRTLIEKQITHKYPQVKYGVWYRPKPNDIKIISKRKWSNDYVPN